MDLDNNKTEQQMDMTEEEIVNAYLNQLDADTPDLWDRIEAGLDTYENTSVGPTVDIDNKESVSSIKNIEYIEKKRKKKTPIKWIPTVVSLAALLLAALLVLPYLAGGRRKMTDSAMDTNEAVSKDEAENWFSNDAAWDAEEYDAESDASSGGDYNGAVYDDTVSNEKPIQSTTNGSDGLTEGTGNSQGVDMEEQGISCDLCVFDETNGIYHCEIISIEENPFDLADGMEIDVVCTQGELQVSEDTTVQVEICGRQEDGYYIVLIK